MEEKVLSILKKVFDLDAVDISCSQDNCEKWDSMGQLNLAVELEDEFGIILEPEDIEGIHDVRSIIDTVDRKRRNG